MTGGAARPSASRTRPRRWRCASAWRCPRAAPPACSPSSWHDEIHEAVGISTCNRTELYLVAGDRVAAESEALAVLARQADIPPTELLGRIYSRPRPRRGAPPVLRRRRARLHDRRGGRDAGPGQARVRARARGGRDGPDRQPSLPRRAGRRQARADETGVGRRTCRCHRWRWSWPRTSSATWSARRVLVVGAGENGELTARALRERGRGDGVGWPTAATTARSGWRSASAARPCASTTCRPSSCRPTSSSPPPGRRTRSSPGRSSSWGWSGEGRPLVLIDLAVPRDIEPEARELPGITLYDMDDLQREVARNLSGREAEAARALTIVDEEVEGFGQCGQPRRPAHHRGPPPARRGDRRAGAARERAALAVPLRRPTAGGWRR